jgi:hypothetical protein
MKNNLYISWLITRHKNIIEIIVLNKLWEKLAENIQKKMLANTGCQYSFFTKSYGKKFKENRVAIKFKGEHGDLRLIGKYNGKNTDGLCQYQLTDIGSHKKNSIYSKPKK